MSRCSRVYTAHISCSHVLYRERNDSDFKGHYAGSAKAALMAYISNPECPSGPGGVCGGLGRCEGEGTRRGDGECVCDPGYSGHLCQSCADGYYREKSSNDSIRACAGVTHSHCLQTLCGFYAILGHQKSTVSLSPRLSSLTACYHSCKKCAGPEDYKCLDCKPGWVLHDNKCVGACLQLFGSC